MTFNDDGSLPTMVNDHDGCYDSMLISECQQLRFSETMVDHWPPAKSVTTRLTVTSWFLLWS